MSGAHRVVFLGHTASLSGGEIAIANLLGALDRVDAHVLLAEEGPIVERFRAAGAEVEVVPLGERSRTLHREEVAGLGAIRPAADAVRYAASLASRIRRLRPDIVHTISLKSALYGGTAAQLARAPVVWSIQDRIALDYQPASVVKMVRTASRVVPNAIIANSAATASTLPRGRVPIDVVHPAVPVLSQAPARDASPYRVGIVGRLSAWKGQHVFLDAFAKAFAGTDAQARLIGAPLFGEEAYEADLHAQVERLGLADRVEFRGLRGDADALAAAMTRLADDPELSGRLVAAARAKAPQFAPDAAAAATQAVYDRVLHHRRAR